MAIATYFCLENLAGSLNTLYLAWYKRDQKLDLVSVCELKNEMIIMSILLQNW